MNTEEYLQEVESEVSNFQQTEKQRLNLQDENKEQWYDANPTSFTEDQRAHTTILHAGLTMAHDLFIQSAFRGLGYKVEAMDVPDNRALQFGREFGNRGQCNPTYFTVGNLVKKLKQMHAAGLDKKEIIENYIFATAGSCGPCRFGTYVTEYRKALRDAGFEGFRVLLFQQAGGLKQATGAKAGLKIDANFFLTMGKAIILGDALNAYMYRIRPYELEKGATDAALTRAKERLARALETRKGMWQALRQTRKELAAIKVDRSQVKPRVAIIGEFWAMTTEGDGNYKMQRFLEQEGAEVEIQLVVNWVLYMMWTARYDTLERARLKGADLSLQQNKKGSKFALGGVQVGKKLMLLKAGEYLLRGMFAFYARMLGLRAYKLPDMDHIAEISHEFYDNNLRGGEGHMEVGKLIHNVVDNSVNMTLSIKPFGCMPSSAVSDGVQSLITEIYPQAIFLPIETNGDGAVNVYSRVQMQLFKARKVAQAEVEKLLQDAGWDTAMLQNFLRKYPQMQQADYRAAHVGASSAYDVVADVRRREQGAWLENWIARMRVTRKQKQRKLLDQVRAIAANLKNGEEDKSTQVVRFVEP